MKIMNLTSSETSHYFYRAFSKGSKLPVDENIFAALIFITERNDLYENYEFDFLWNSS